MKNGSKSGPVPTKKKTVPWKLTSRQNSVREAIVEAATTKADAIRDDPNELDDPFSEMDADEFRNFCQNTARWRYYYPINDLKKDKKDSGFSDPLEGMPQPKQGEEADALFEVVGFKEFAQGLYHLESAYYSFPHHGDATDTKKKRKTNYF